MTTHVDAHVHVVDFLQHVAEPRDLIEALDQAGAAKAVVFGLSVKKKWELSEPMRPTYYLDDNAPCATYELTDELVADFVAALPPQERDRLAPLICGFDPTDLLTVEHVERMIGRHDGWRGVGELMLRHDDLTNLTYGETRAGGSPGPRPGAGPVRPAAGAARGRRRRDGGTGERPTPLVLLAGSSAVARGFRGAGPQTNRGGVRA